MVHSECCLDIVDVRESLYLSNANSTIILPIVGEYFGDVLNGVSSDVIRDRFNIVNNSAAKFLNRRNFTLVKSDSCALDKETGVALGYGIATANWSDSSITRLSCNLVQYSEIHMLQRIFEYQCSVHEYYYCSSLKYLTGACG